MAFGTRWLLTNLADAGTITTDSAVSGLPVTNLQDQQLSKAWRAAAVSCYLLVDLGSQKSVSFVGLFGTGPSMTAAITRRIRVSTADATGAAGDAKDTTAQVAPLSTTYDQIIDFFSPVTGRYVRIDLVDTVAPEIGRLVIGATTTPSIGGWNFPADMLPEDLTRQQETPSGNVFLNRGPVRRVLDITTPALSEAEAWAILDDAIANGNTRDVLLCLDAADATYLHQKTVWGTLKETTPVTWRAHGLLGRRWRLTERISDTR